MRSFIFILALSVLTVPLAAIHAQPTSHQAYLWVAKHKVCAIDETTGEATEIFSDSGFIIQNYLRRGVELSPSGNFLCVTGRRPPAGRFGDGKVMPDKHLIIIVDVRNGQSFEIDKGHQFSWAPGKDRMTYLLGEYYDDDGEYFTGTTAWLYDPVTQESERILPEEVSIAEINWARHVHRIYAGSDGRVMYFDPSSGESGMSAYRSSNISPRGKYCFVNSVHSDPCSLFATGSDSPIELTGVEEETLYEGGPVMRLLHWYRGNDSTL